MIYYIVGYIYIAIQIIILLFILTLKDGVNIIIYFGTQRWSLWLDGGRQRPKSQTSLLLTFKKRIIPTLNQGGAHIFEIIHLSLMF